MEPETDVFTLDDDMHMVMLFRGSSICACGNMVEPIGIEPMT